MRILLYQKEVWSREVVPDVWGREVSDAVVLAFAEAELAMQQAVGALTQAYAEHEPAEAQTTEEEDGDETATVEG